MEVIILFLQINNEARRLRRDWPNSHSGKVAGPHSRLRPARQPVHRGTQRKAGPAALGDTSHGVSPGLTSARPRQLPLGPVLRRTVLSPTPASAIPPAGHSSLRAFQSPRSRQVTRRRAQPPGKCSTGPGPLCQLLSRQTGQSEQTRSATQHFPSSPLPLLHPRSLQVPAPATHQTTGLQDPQCHLRGCTSSSVSTARRLLPTCSSGGGAEDHLAPGKMVRGWRGVPNKAVRTPQSPSHTPFLSWRPRTPEIQGAGCSCILRLGLRGGEGKPFAMDALG